MDGARLGTRLDIPKVGEHTRDVLSGLGYAATAIERMATDKVINIG